MVQIQIRAGPEGETLMNEAGEVTSHLNGLFYRTIKMLDSGLKPVYVFDGKPPELKGGEVSREAVAKGGNLQVPCAHCSIA